MAELTPEEAQLRNQFLFSVSRRLTAWSKTFAQAVEHNDTSMLLSIWVDMVNMINTRDLAMGLIAADAEELLETLDQRSKEEHERYIQAMIRNGFTQWANLPEEEQ